MGARVYFYGKILLRIYAMLMRKQKEIIKTIQCGQHRFEHRQVELQEEITGTLIMVSLFNKMLRFINNLCKILKIW